MKTVVLALGGATAAWMAAPAVSMALHGTIDRRTLAACRQAVPATRPVVVIPTQRRGTAGERLSA